MIQLDNEEAILSLQNSILSRLGLDPLPYTMRKRQIEAVISFVENNNDVAVFLPTGYGKTLVALLNAMFMWKEKKKKTILIGLLKALTQEQFNDFSEYVPCIIDDGDHKTSIDQYEEEEWVISCLTPEKFDSIITNPQKREKIMQDVGMIITDEIHTLGDSGRGHRMENYLISTRMLYPELRYTFLSATVGNPEEFAEWLESELIIAKADERPVPLQIDMKKYQEIVRPWDNQPDFYANYKVRIQILRDLIQSYPSNDCWIIFCTSRARTESVAKDLKYIRKYITIQDLVEEYEIGYHNAGMSIEDKNYVEEAFRNGTINVICATPTLAVGVNLPADHCVIFDVEQYSSTQGQEIINANRIQQTIGRAGRPGLSEMGYAHVITSDRCYDDVYDRVYNPLVVKSQLKPRLHEKILQWVAGGIASDMLDVMELCEMSYASITEEEAIKSIEWLKAFGFLNENDEGLLEITRIGTMTVRMYVLPETVVKWQAQVCNVKDSNNIKEVFTRFGAVEEYFNIITVRSEDENIVAYSQSELGSFFPPMREHCNGRMCLTCDNGYECLKKEFIKSECADYISNIPDAIPEELLKCYFLTFYNDLAEKYLPKKKKKVNGRWIQTDEIKHIPISKGDRMLLSKAGGRMFNASSVIFSNNKQLSNTLKTLSILTEAGTLDKYLADLMKLKRIGIVLAKKLRKAGIKTRDDFLSSSPLKLAKILGKSKRFVQGLLEINLEF